ncbi:hypothetical protein AC1031_017939 [Aphanomyces cochlioides]|nr:hypothetical protein AC1031_017939 [Aphanomyces cochlioides]
MLCLDFCNEHPSSFRHCANYLGLARTMRLFVTHAIATSAVVAFNQPRQDSPVVLAHQQVRMDAAVNDLRVLQGGLDGKNTKRGLRGQAASGQEVASASYGSADRRLAAAGNCCIKGQSSPRRQNNAADLGLRQGSSSRRRDNFAGPLNNQGRPVGRRRQPGGGQAGGQPGGRLHQRQESMAMSGPLGSPGSSGRYSRQSSSGRLHQRQESMAMNGPLGSPGSSGRYSRQSTSGRRSI